MSILTDIRAEIQRAEEKHGPLPIHVSPSAALVLACSSLEQIAREDLDGQTTAGSLAILAEEVGEAARAETTADLRAELVQVVAVGIRWIGQIDGLSAADCIPPQIVSTPDTIGGAPRIDGTRIPASLILAMFAAGRSETEIVADYPSLTPAQILACLAYAAENVSAAANPSIMEALGLPTDDSPKNAVEQIRRLREERNTFRRELREYQEDARVNGDRAAAMMEALPRNRFAGGTRLDEMVIRVCEMLASAERERDAYRRAKAENDERFQLEAGEQRARAEAAEARLAALLAPVEGVDLEEVLRLDREATPGPWAVEMRCVRYVWDPNTVHEVPSGILATDVEHTVLEYDFTNADDNAALIATYRTTGPVMAREIARLRDGQVTLRCDDVRRELLATTPSDAHAAINALFARIEIPVGPMFERERLGRDLENAQAEATRLRARLAEVEQERDEARDQAHEK